jgi:ketosteroid isomerase-like protein
MPGNGETVHTLSDAFAAGDVDAALACLHTEVELLTLRARLEGTTYVGHEGYRQVLALFDQDWDDLRLVPERIEEIGDRVVATGRLMATGKTSGIELDLPLTLLYHFRDGLIVRMESFDEHEDAMAAAREG